MKGLIAKKVGMTQVFDESGNLTPVTVIQVEPNVVVAKKTKENCGYDAVVLGLDDMKASKANKAYAGQFPENITPKRHLKEFRNFEKEVNVGDVVGLERLDSGSVLAGECHSLLIDRLYLNHGQFFFLSFLVVFSCAGSQHGCGHSQEDKLFCLHYMMFLFFMQ